MGVCGSKEASAEPLSAQNKAKQLPAAQRGSKSQSTSAPSSGSSGEKLAVPQTAANNSSNLTTEPRKGSLPTVIENKELSTLGTEKKPKQAVKHHAKILLLGAGESGKSTILKQIKIIHQNGFTERERLDYKPFVYNNVISSAQSIVSALTQFDLAKELTHVSQKELEEITSRSVQLETSEKIALDAEITDIIKRLIEEPAVIKLLNQHGPEFYILDSAVYFFSSIDRISKEDYIPDDMDILRTRRQTSGIFDTKFQMDDIDIHLFDVGGQRSERKKWIHCFDNVTAIMFCVALSEYDQTLLESSNSNRLEESLDLFDSVINSMWFRRTSIILCLNKIDLFIEKLPKSPLENVFPDYAGGDDVGKAVKYILWRFKQLNRSNLNMVPYVTQATDTSNIQSAFAVVKETIVHNNLVDSGVIQAPTL